MANLEAFRLKQLQDFKAVALALKENNIPIDDFIVYVDKQLSKANMQKEKTKRDGKAIIRRARRANKSWAKIAKKCPHCNSIMFLYDVNTADNNRVDGDWKAVWICGNKECMEDIYIKETREETLKRIARRKKNSSKRKIKHIRRR